VKYQAFATLLLSKMHEWESSKGKRVTIQGFAEYLEVSQPLLSIWLKGNTKPTEENIQLLAGKLGNKIYDSLGITRPNPLHQYIASHWDQLPEEEQIRISKIVSKYTKDPLPNETETQPAAKS
jgi:transcriptional regulator with XRE-family HTH domain